jgi:SAM-dependent methyltransferase
MRSVRASSLYESSRLAAGYAFSRPPVHQAIIARIAGRLPTRQGGLRALDVGCGAGLSTAALAPAAPRRVGLEPSRAMLAYGRSVDPGAQFVAGRAERLPFASQSFDLVAAAGSLNYVNLDAFLPEAARVLDPGGMLLVYDFSAARRMRGDARLSAWFEAFERRYPFPPGYALDIRTTNLAAHGFRLVDYLAIEAAVPMTPAAYLDYAMSETSVELALARGEGERRVREWCATGLEPLFASQPREILFDAYVALIGLGS